MRSDSSPATGSPASPLEAPQPGAEHAPKACPVCASTEVTLVVETPPLPVLCNVSYATREEALQAPRGEMRLGFCTRCGHIYNHAFNPALIAYTRAYENSLHFSPRFQQYAEALADRLIDRYGLHGKTVLEIGCGKGEFLTLLCRKGPNTGIGFDPGYEPDPGQEGLDERVTVIPDYYRASYVRSPVDLVCCRHVLEHIPRPAEFMRMVRRSLGDQHRTALYVEVPDARYMLRRLAIWDIIYEHCSYFSDASLSSLFVGCGFRPHTVASTFEGQYLYIEAFPDEAIADAAPPNDGRLDALAQEVAAFRHRYAQKVDQWHRRLRTLTRRGRRAVIWGAGSKGVTISNILNAREHIEYVVDINPRKQGRYVAGTGQRIVAPDFLRDYRPDVVILVNPIYKDEIRRTTTKLGLAPAFLTA